VPHTTSDRRERKKQRTREAIVEHAMALFRERGFDATTIGDIAEAADIAPRTFFGYFATKEDVVFHDFEEVLAEFRACLEDRPASQTAFETLRAWVAEQASKVSFDSEAHRARRKLIRETPSLSAHDRANVARFETVFAEAVARDLGVEADSLRAHLVSAAAVAALDVVGRHDPAESQASDPMAVVDEAVVFLEGGLKALRRHGAGKRA